MTIGQRFAATSSVNTRGRYAADDFDAPVYGVVYEVWRPVSCDRSAGDSDRVCFEDDVGVFGMRSGLAGDRNTYAATTGRRLAR